MVETGENVSKRATETWEVVIDTFPIYGDILFMLYFKHRDHSFKFLHRQFRNLHDARQEQHRLAADLEQLRCDKFMEKYRIGYDLKGSIL